MADSEITGTAQVIRNLSSYKENVIREVVAACTAVQQSVINNAHERVPVVTGNLYGSIQPSDIVIADDDVTAAVVANANYASFVEYGTGRSRAKPYLQPALLENQATFRMAIAAAVKRAKAA